MTDYEIQAIVMDVIDINTRGGQTLPWSMRAYIAKGVARRILERLGQAPRKPDPSGSAPHYPTPACQCGAQRVSQATKHATWCPIG